MKKADFIYDVSTHEEFFFSQLTERGKRHYAGLESMKLEYNGVDIISKRFGIHKHTIRKGEKELMEQTKPPINRIRQKGGGRKKRLSYRA